MNKDIEPNSAEESSHRSSTYAMFGIVAVGLCALLFLAYQWLQPVGYSLIAQYFPSPTPSRQPTGTPAPTRTPLPNLTATQQAWVKPAQLPSLGSAEEAREAVDIGVFYLEAFSTVFPDLPEINQPGDVYLYEIQLFDTMPLVWSYAWCTTTQEILEENFTHIQLEFIVNETPVPPDQFAVIDYQRSDDAPCREYAVLVKEWTPGQHQLESRVTFTQSIHDGWDLYPGGTHIYKYIVTVP